MELQELALRERQEADWRARRAVNFACSHVREALQTKTPSFGEQLWSLKLLPIAKARELEERLRRRIHVAGS